MHLYQDQAFALTLFHNRNRTSHSHCLAPFMHFIQCVTKFPISPVCCYDRGLGNTSPQEFDVVAVRQSKALQLHTFCPATK
ncbi:hypothetical protein GCE9029_04576 [Grimontia celer]|uniref:Uncharacterized protein n=1 Tax=Grimontia celer TaxID=1796497 RepID=A0A128FE09_9GAMM|nr:hypothetical protein GCE9029_04576 [Grimontia celer]